METPPASTQQIRYQNFMPFRNQESNQRGEIQNKFNFKFLSQQRKKFHSIKTVKSIQLKTSKIYTKNYTSEEQEQVSGLINRSKTSKSSAKIKPTPRKFSFMDQLDPKKNIKIFTYYHEEQSNFPPPPNENRLTPIDEEELRNIGIVFRKIEIEEEFSRKGSAGKKTVIYSQSIMEKLQKDLEKDRQDIEQQENTQKQNAMLRKQEKKEKKKEKKEAEEKKQQEEQNQKKKTIVQNDIKAKLQAHQVYLQIKMITIHNNYSMNKSQKKSKSFNKNKLQNNNTNQNKMNNNPQNKNKTLQQKKFPSLKQILTQQRSLQSLNQTQPLYLKIQIIFKI